MQVLFLSSWFPHPADNGSKIRVHHLLHALCRHHDVTLLSFAYGTARPGDASELRTWCRRLETVPCDPSRRSRVACLLRFFSPSPIVAASIPDMARLVQRVAAEVPFDVAIASTIATATYARRLDCAPRVLEEHNSLTHWMWERYQAQGSALQRLRCWASWQKARLYEARLYRHFDLCVMVSEQDRQASVQMLPGYSGWMEVVSNGVDCEHNRPGLVQPKPGTLVFNGAMTYSANHDAMRYFLSEIYPRIRCEEPAVSLTITGSTAGVDLSSLSLDESLRLSGPVEDVRPLVAGASVCVVPIRQGGGTRLKILEAMALGTPVVTTSKGAEGLDVMPEEDILVADDPARFAAEVVRLLRDPALRQRLARNARRLVEGRYDWQAIGMRFTQLVEAVAGERART